MTFLDETTIICEKCRYVLITFDPKRRGKYGGLVPIEYRTRLPHVCSASYPYQCSCGKLIYTDLKVLSRKENLIPLNYDDDCYHFCSKEVKK